MMLLLLPLLLLTKAATPHIGMIYQETKQEESLREPDLCKPQFISEPNLLRVNHRCAIADKDLCVCIVLQGKLPKTGLGEK